MGVAVAVDIEPARTVAVQIDTVLTEVWGFLEVRWCTGGHMARITGLPTQPRSART